MERSPLKYRKQAGQATLEFTIMFIAAAILLVGLTSLWKISSNKIPSRQASYNNTRLQAGSSSPGEPTVSYGQSGSSDRGDNSIVANPNVALGSQLYDPRVDDSAMLNQMDQAVADANSGAEQSTAGAQAEAQEQIAEMESRQQEIQARIDEINAEIATIEAQIDSLEAEKAGKEQELAQVDADIQAAQQAGDSTFWLNLERNAIEDDINDIDNSIDHWQAEIQPLIDQRTFLQQSYNDLEAKQEALRAI